jgi:hypothetical protein
MKAAMAIGLFFPALLWASAAMADCKCMANGRVFHHGEIACLRLPSGPQLAQCGMVLNNSSWIKLQDGCPLAETRAIQFKVTAIAPHGFPEQSRMRWTGSTVEICESNDA